VYILAEKVRVKIARINFPASSTRTSYTVSIGVASCTGRSSVDEAFTNAQMALDKAVNDGGNKTTNIN
jgi:PleD family two-component response regulator